MFRGHQIHFDSSPRKNVFVYKRYIQFRKLLIRFVSIDKCIHIQVTLSTGWPRQSEDVLEAHIGHSRLCGVPDLDGGGEEPGRDVKLLQDAGQPNITTTEGSRPWQAFASRFSAHFSNGVTPRIFAHVFPQTICAFLISLLHFYFASLLLGPLSRPHSVRARIYKAGELYSGGYIDHCALGCIKFSFFPKIKFLRAHMPP